MDVSHMDTPTARLVITFGLEDVTDTIIKITGADDAKLNPVDEAQLRGLETLRQTLENQLEMLDQDQAVNDSKDNMILDEPNDVNDLGSGDESFSSVGSPFDEVTDEEDVTGEKINLNGTTDRESDHDECTSKLRLLPGPALMTVDESIVVRDYLECPNCSNSWFEEDAPKFCAKCLTNSHEFLSVFDGEKMPRELVPKEKDTPRKKAILERRIQCMACEDYVPIKSTEQLKCEPESHVYCHACLHDIVRSALYTDTSLFPPRCCNKPIPIEICRQVFPPSKAAEFEMRFERLSMANPTDCYNCMQFVPAGNIVADVAVCAHCAARTCIACKAQKHDGLCKEDPYVKLLSATASEYKWQTCRKCKNMVELDIGCFHMV